MACVSASLGARRARVSAGAARSPTGSGALVVSISISGGGGLAGLRVRLGSVAVAQGSRRVEHPERRESARRLRRLHHLPQAAGAVELGEQRAHHVVAVQLRRDAIAAHPRAPDRAPCARADRRARARRSSASRCPPGAGCRARRGRAAHPRAARSRGRRRTRRAANRSIRAGGSAPDPSARETGPSHPAARGRAAPCPPCISPARRGRSGG